MAASNIIRVMTADDHPLIREGLAALILVEPDIEIVAEAEDGMSAVTLYQKHRPDVMLLDLQMPEISGLEVIEQVISWHAAARIIVLTTYSTEHLAAKSIAAGASGYILKSSVGRKLLEVIRAVMRGQRYVDPAVASGIVAYESEDDLTHRETEILTLISKGNSNKTVGDHLGISDQTVKGHLKNIFAKLGANDRAHAVALAVKRGIIEV